MLTRIRKRSKEIYFGDIRAQLGAYRRRKVSFGDLKTKSAANIVLKTPSSTRKQEAREIKTYLSLPSRTRRFLYCYDADFFFFLIKKVLPTGREGEIFKWPHLRATPCWQQSSGAGFLVVLGGERRCPGEAALQEPRGAEQGAGAEPAYL